MPELDDHQVLAEYARTGSEAAFAALVARYASLVYSAAWRFTGNAHHAEEISQAVFIILARKAGSLRRGTVLPGWLYQTARLTAANFMKGESRRYHREQEAYMQSTLNEPDTAAWDQIAPLLEEAMGRLGETDRNAVLLRFFQKKTIREVAAVLRMNEGAAHMRVNRAVEKLRVSFTKRGIVLSAVAFASVMSANSVQAAPAGLAVVLTATAAKGASLSAPLAALVEGTLKIMTWMKIKFAIGVGLATLLATCAAALVMPRSTTDSNPTQEPSPQEPSHLTTNSPFIAYLQNPPWIKHIRFGRSEFMRAGRTPAQINIEQWTIMDRAAALQPNGFFMEMLSSNLPGFGPAWAPDEREIYGMCDDYLWSVAWGGEASGKRRALVLSSKIPGQGGSKDDRAQIIDLIWKSVIERTRLFGLPALKPGSFTLGDSNEFEALTDSHWVQEMNSKASLMSGETVRGRFGDIRHDKPYNVAFSVSNNVFKTERYYKVEYQYESPEQPLPNHFEFFETTSLLPKQYAYIVTNWIYEVEYGIDEKATTGYVPSMFFTNLDLLTETMIVSNKIAYTVGTNGTLRKGPPELTQAEIARYYGGRPGVLEEIFDAFDTARRNQYGILAAMSEVFAVAWRRSPVVVFVLTIMLIFLPMLWLFWRKRARTVTRKF